MKGAIIYHGKYGATEQYATWLAQELKLTCKATQDCNARDFAGNDFLVIGSSVYIGMLLIKKWIKINAKSLAGKTIYFFIVSGTPAGEKEKLQSYLESSIPAEIRKNCKPYFLPGRLTYKKLSLADKMMIRIGYLLSSKKDKEKSGFADYDAVKKENLITLIGDIRQRWMKERQAASAL